MVQSLPPDQAHPPQTVTLIPWPRLIPPQPPAPLTQLVGREPELAAGLDLLVRREVRLVTLTGPGGVGKTRLAEAIAARARADFQDGVAWIGLAAVAESALVLPTLVRSFGIGEASGRRPLDLIATALRDQRLLLVLDNLEHLVDAAPELAACLVACPSISILATSRTRLRVRGEHVIPVPPLSLPASGVTDSADGYGSEAVRLFWERASAAVPDLRMTPEAIEAAAEICRRVDGLPLGIELAAARTNVLTLEAIRDRLDRRLPLLTGGARDLPDRQRTMHDAIAWSYDLLSPDEQALFRRLSVFVDGFSLAAAEFVGEGDALDLLGSLVDKSLVRFDTAAPGGGRYSVLETIREFAAHRLEAEGEAATAHRRQAAWMLAVAEEQRLRPLLPAERDHVEHLECERGNLRSALAWWEASGDTASFARMVAALGWFWWSGGHLREGAPWLERAWERSAGPDGVGGASPGLAIAHGYILASQGDLDRAETTLRVGLRLAQEAHDAVEAVALLVGLGWIANQREQHEEAEAHLDAALGAVSDVSDPRQAATLTGTILGNLGVGARASGRFTDAERYHERALRLHREAGHPVGVVHSLVDLGMVARDRGDAAAAGVRLREGLRLAWEHKEWRYLIAALEGLACIYAADDAPRAVRLFAAAQLVRDRLGATEDDPVDRAASERATASCREVIGAEGFAAAWSEGGAQALDRVIAEALDQNMAAADAPAISLTPREREILPLLTAGLSNRAIGEALYIGDRTVQSHVERIFSKLGVRTRAAAATAAISAGLVDPSLPDSL